MMQAKIECPHCGGSITIRARNGDDIKPEEAAAVWKAADDMFKAIDAGFRRIFDQPFWRR